jgi:predicted nucleic acid-binding protein
MMLFFLDGSALAKRYVAEPGTALLDYLFDRVAVDRLIVLNVGFAEVVSIMVRRKNAGTLSGGTFSQALLHLGQEVIHAPSLRKLEPTNSLVIGALAHIENHSVNATDAIVLHAVLGLAHHLRGRGDDVVLVTSDQRLLRAAQAEGRSIRKPKTKQP